jgi:hypothetical protein
VILSKRFKKRFTLDFTSPSGYYPHRFLLPIPCSEEGNEKEILRPHFLKEEEWGFLFNGKPAIWKSAFLGAESRAVLGHY